MSTVTIAVDLAKNVFELAIASRAGTIRQRKRLSRPQFEQFWGTQTPCRVVMEACASSHFWGRYLRARGFAVIHLPPHYVKPYRRRNKTDRTDCEGSPRGRPLRRNTSGQHQERGSAGADRAASRPLAVARESDRARQHHACAAARVRSPRTGRRKTFPHGPALHPDSEPAAHSHAHLPHHRRPGGGSCRPR